MKAKRILYSIATVLLVMGVIYVDQNPNPAPSIGEDPGMWLFTVASVLLFLHGVLSGFVFGGKKQRILYLALSAVALTVLFFCLRMSMGIGFVDSLLMGLAAIVLFLPCMCVGMLLAAGIAWVCGAVKRNGDPLRYRYEK